MKSVSLRLINTPLFLSHCYGSRGVIHLGTERNDNDMKIYRAGADFKAAKRCARTGVGLCVLSQGLQIDLY